MRRLLLAASLLLAAATPVLAEPALRGLDRFEMRIGDRGPWVPVELWQVPAPGDEVWLRAPVQVPAGLRRAGQLLGIYVAALASHELWWDGELLGRGGVVGRTAVAERAGPVEAHYQVPDRLAAPGWHRLTLRTSAFHRHFSPAVGYWEVVVGDYEGIVTMRRQAGWLAAVALSALLLTAAFALGLFVVVRERASLLLALLALSAAGMLVAEAWRPLLGYTYDRHIVRLFAELALSWLTGLQLVALVIVRYPHRGGRLTLAIAAAASTGLPFLLHAWDAKSLSVYVACLCAALAWSGAAVLRRSPGSGLTLVGLVVAAGVLALEPLRFLDYSLYYSLDFLFLCLLWSHAGEVGKVREARVKAELKSARLELEMVKRHLHPHFLMNTLTALVEWIEQEPRTAVRMIGSLCEELRMLADLSPRKLIRLDEELRLCRHHLDTMSLRQDVVYELEVAGVRGDEAIPPAVLHTLVENAVTHGAASERMTLHLSAEGNGSRWRLVLESPADATAVEEDAVAGAGTRYVEARLREVWGEDWSFRQGLRGGAWRVELEMPSGWPV